ncbi:MAG: alkyl hydroperoxide reductase/Thiol specific antioxidant/Mal allergen [Flavipsychrobacter sp.]|nr:alkyl hydroperoxide reductase/Thiol specific antioxidant/Mal allergen [Flavipsychrobacter sp.]
MKKTLLLVALLFIGISQVLAAPTYKSYHIKLKITDINDTIANHDTLIYLLHYYGKGRPTIFKLDSARIDKAGNAEFKSNDSAFTGGIYIMLLSNRRADFEFLLNKGDDMGITVNLGKLPDAVVFKNSPENERFEEYIGFLKDYSKGQEALKKELTNAKTKADTNVIRDKSIAQAKKLTNYRRDYMKNNPGTLLAGIFGGMEVPEVPEGPHFLADGVTKDSAFAYHYYKSHFWDGFNFQDDRMIYTPLYDQKLEEYFSKLVVPVPDSMNHEADMILKKAKGTKDVFHYSLWWLTRNAENSKVMGMDEAFVYLVENYYMKGDAFWLKPDELSKYLERAQKIAPNVIGNLAPEIKVPNVVTKKEESLLGSKGKYTIVVFYSPSCGHCQHEIPALDSVYNEVLKAKGVKIFTVATEGEEKAITDFITKNKLESWTNTWNPDHTSDYHSKYDVYSTPTIYLLDEKKIIRGKRLDHTNIAGLVEMLEKKEKDKNKAKK